MKFHAMVLGMCHKTIEADGPCNAYLKYKEFIKEAIGDGFKSIEDDLKYMVSFTEVDENDENSIYQHNFYFDNEGIIEPNLTQAKRFKRVKK